jgi:hypothetical protein
MVLVAIVAVAFVLALAAAVRVGVVRRRLTTPDPFESWWPQFEREFRAYARERERELQQEEARRRRRQSERGGSAPQAG